MTKALLDEREFELINIIGADLGSNQRELSRQLDLSLGLTNMLVRRLVTKGLIRISQLNKRKVKYVLTPKGFAEKMRKSMNYTLKTVSSISLIKDRVRDVVSRLYAEGERAFVVLGRSDFALLIELVLKELEFNDCRLSYVDDVPQSPMEGVLLICRENVIVGQNIFRKSIDLIHELAKDESFINHMGNLS